MKVGLYANLSKPDAAATLKALATSARDLGVTLITSSKATARLAANCRTVAPARLGKSVEDCRLFWIEDPTPAEDESEDEDFESDEEDEDEEEDIDEDDLTDEDPFDDQVDLDDMDEPSDRD